MCDLLSKGSVTEVRKPNSIEFYFHNNSEVPNILVDTLSFVSALNNFQNIILYRIPQYNELQSHYPFSTPGTAKI